MSECCCISARPCWHRYYTLVTLRNMAQAAAAALRSPQAREAPAAMPNAPAAAQLPEGADAQPSGDAAVHPADGGDSTAREEVQDAVRTILDVLLRVPPTPSRDEWEASDAQSWSGASEVRQPGVRPENLHWLH